jgi:hypothetical protein
VTEAQQGSGTPPEKTEKPETPRQVRAQSAPTPSGKPGATVWDEKGAPNPNKRLSLAEDPEGKKNKAAARKGKK